MKHDSGVGYPVRWQRSGTVVEQGSSTAHPPHPSRKAALKMTRMLLYDSARLVTLDQPNPKVLPSSPTPTHPSCLIIGADQSTDYTKDTVQRFNRRQLIPQNMYFSVVSITPKRCHAFV